MNRLNCAGIALWAAAMLAASPARGIVTLDTSFGVTDADYINLGAQFPAVGIFAPESNTAGVLVAPDWVLTAAHVAGPLTPGTSLFSIGGNSYGIAATIINPGYSASPINNDIALVHLASTVSNVTPVTLYTGHNEAGVIATWVAFGLTGTGITGAGASGGPTKRGGTNVVDAYAFTSNTPVPDIYLTNNSNLGTFLVADFDDSTSGNNTLSIFGSSPAATSLESGLASGDSGGGVFANFGYGPLLIGINDFIAPGSHGSATQYSALDGATRVSAYASWIQTQVPGVQTQIPEPGVAPLLTGLLAGMMALVRLRRFRS